MKTLIALASAVSLAACVQSPAPSAMGGGPVAAAVPAPPRQFTLPLIPTEEGMIYPVLINGVPIDFMLDTGATTSSITPSVALALMKTGTLSADNISGHATMINANGTRDKAICFQIDLQHIKYYLRDFEVCTSPRQDINLLGRNFLDQFTEWSITPHGLVVTP